MTPEAQLSMGLSKLNRIKHKLNFTDYDEVSEKFIDDLLKEAKDAGIKTRIRYSKYGVGNNVYAIQFASYGTHLVWINGGGYRQYYWKPKNSKEKLSLYNRH